MLHKNITCPHCGLLCDDLIIETDGLYQFEIKSDLAASCMQSMQASRLNEDKLPSATVNGQAVSADIAIKAAADIIRRSQQTLISGLIGDIEAARGAVALADQIGGIFDHAQSNGLFQNVSTMQRYGTIATTLAEARNRADCIVVFGNGTLHSFPRFLERIAEPKKTLSPGLKRKVFVIDIDGAASFEAGDAIDVEFISVPVKSLENAVQTLNYALLEDKHTGFINPALQSMLPVAKTIKSSEYTVFTWAGDEFNPDSGQTTVQNINACIKELAEKHRCVGLPLGGSKGQITVNQVSTWQTGFPLRTRFIEHQPEHNQALYSAQSLIENRNIDTLVWVSLFDPNDVPPKTEASTILIGHPNMQADASVDVFIPAAIPGIDVAGLACRTDNVATLPLQKIREIGLVPAHKTIANIMDCIRDQSSTKETSN